MRNNDPIFWPDSATDLALRNQMEKNYTDCINVLQTQWFEADCDQRCCMGDQDLWASILPGVANTNRRKFNFNLVNSMIQMITGYQRRNRKATICVPITNSDQKTADQLTKCLYYVHGNSAYQVYSDCFEQGALIQGLGFCSIYQDFSSDPISGDIKIRYVDMKSTLYDPYFRRHDMSDCRYFWTRQFFGQEEAALIYPEYADQILSLPKGTYKDDKFYYMPEVYQIQFPNLIALDEYWYLTSREATYLVDVQSNECQEFTGTKEQLKDLMQMFRHKLKVVKKPKPTVRRSIIINDKVLIDEPNPYGLDRYPYVPSLGYFTADTEYYGLKFRGVVRDLRSVQYLVNLRKITDLDILSSQQQGLKVKKGALVTPQDGMNSGNGRMLVIDDNFQMDDVQPMPIVPPAPTMIQMEEMLVDIMYKISAVSPEMMGQDIDDKSGLITMIRNAAGTTTLTRLFDQFDEFQRLCGEIIVEMIQKNWTYGKVRQVTGEDPTPEFDNKLFLKYGCKVVQGALTETQQQLELQQLLYFRESTGIDIPSEVILKASTLQNKDEVIEAVVKREQAAQQQQEQMSKLQMQQMQVDNATKMGYAHSQDAKAQETIAKIQVDKAEAEERLNRAEEERTASVLNLVKAVKELKDMDLNHLQRELDMVLSIKQNEREEANIKAGVL